MSEVYDASFLKRHACQVSFGDTELGIPSSPIRIRFLQQSNPCNLYGNGQSVPSQHLLAREAEVVIVTGKCAAALSLLAEAEQRTDLFAPDALHPLVFSPVAATAEKTLTFPSAALIPEADFEFSRGRDHTVQLLFRCFAGTAGLFTFV